MIVDNTPHMCEKYMYNLLSNHTCDVGNLVAQITDLLAVIPSFS